MSEPPKITLFDQMLAVQNHIEHLKINAEMCRRNGYVLSEPLRRELAAMEQVRKTLELLEIYERPFVALIKQERQRAAAGRSDVSSRAATTSR